MSETARKIVDATKTAAARAEALVAESKAGQAYSEDPLADRETDLYQGEYVKSFVEKWDELIDWDARAESEGRFFIDVLRARGKETVLDVAAGTGFHSVRLIEAGFNVTTADGSAEMLARAFENGRRRGLVLKTAHADWRWLNRDIHGKYDAIICLGNSFTHLHEEKDRRRALAEFYAALKHDGVLILDQRNYDAMLDRGFQSKHKYYYCGDEVVAEPVHLDEGLARFRYSFKDGSEYTLNMFPLRKGYVRRLLSEAGFERVRTYGDFQETYQEDEPDFFVHIAEKSVESRRRPAPVTRETARDAKAANEVTDAAESYYDSDDADAFYQAVWGGEDVHVGCYENTRDIAEASVETIQRMVGKLAEAGAPLGPETRVIDFGAGYGGSARRLAKTHGASVVCLNISEVQNDVNRYKTGRAGLSDKVSVVHGSFDAAPEPDASFEVVWSQDAILHSDRREAVLAEAYRLLKPGGVMVFTDPMQADDVPEGALQAVYDRIGLKDLASPGFYAAAGRRVGLEPLEPMLMTENLRTHYDRVREELESRYDELRAHASAEYLDKMIEGLRRWVESADKGWLAWGVLAFRKPG